MYYISNWHVSDSFVFFVGKKPLECRLCHSARCHVPSTIANCRLPPVRLALLRSVHPLLHLDQQLNSHLRCSHIPATMHRLLIVKRALIDQEVLNPGPTTMDSGGVFPLHWELPTGIVRPKKIANHTNPYSHFLLPATPVNPPRKTIHHLDAEKDVDKDAP